ncbi:MAG: hypothetical protein LC737_05615, partial [Chloroflexi bacterium]|nr:hypothetical protein [Chloroflexota bacterium]
LLRRSGRDALAGYIFVAWNPLMQFELAANGHNDMLMTTFVLLAMWLYAHRRALLAVAAVMLAAAIKFPAAIVMPFLLVAALVSQPNWSQRALWLVGAMLIALLTASVVHAPWWEGVASLAHLLPRQDLFTASPGAVAALWLTPSLGDTQAQMLVRSAAYVLYGGALLVLLARQHASVDSLALNGFLALMLLLLMATLWFQPWYLAWVLPLAALAGAPSRTVAGVFTWSALWNYFIFDFAWFWADGQFSRDNGLLANAAVVALVFAPPLLVAAAHTLHTGRAAPSSHSPAFEREQAVL